MINGADDDVNMAQLPQQQLQESPQPEIQYDAGDKADRVTETVFELQQLPPPTSHEDGNQVFDHTAMDGTCHPSNLNDMTGPPVYYYVPEPACGLNTNPYNGEYVLPQFPHPYWQGPMAPFVPDEYVDTPYYAYNAGGPDHTAPTAYVDASEGQNAMPDHGYHKMEDGMNVFPHPMFRAEEFCPNFEYQQTPFAYPPYQVIPKPWSCYGSGQASFAPTNQSNDGYYPMNGQNGYNPQQNSPHIRNDPPNGQPRQQANSGEQSSGDPSNHLNQGHPKDVQNHGHHRNQAQASYPRNEHNNHHRRYQPNAFHSTNKHYNNRIHNYYYPRNQYDNYHQRNQSSNGMFRNAAPIDTTKPPGAFERRHIPRYPPPNWFPSGQCNQPTPNFESPPKRNPNRRSGWNPQRQHQRQHANGNVRVAPPKPSQSPPGRDGRRPTRSAQPGNQSVAKNSQGTPPCRSGQDGHRDVRGPINQTESTRTPTSSPPLEFLQDSVCTKERHAPAAVKAIIEKSKRPE